MVLGIIAVSDAPWWTLKGASTDQIVSIAVSPFHAQLAGTGLPSSIPFTSATGMGLRLMTVAAAFLLGVSVIRPEVWWRNLAVWFSETSVMILFLSLALVIHSVRTVLLASYGISPPLLGTGTITGTVVGIDLAYYQSPQVLAEFTFNCFVAPMAFVLLAGESLLLPKIPQHELAVPALPRQAKEAVEVDLKPAPRPLSFQSANEVLDFLRASLDKLKDEELTDAFRNLNRTLQPEGRVSLHVPTSLVPLTYKILRLIPRTGFNLETLQVVTRTPGRVENEIVFRKLSPEQEPGPSGEQLSPTELPDSTPPQELKSPDLPEQPASPSAALLLEEAIVDSGLKTIRIYEKPVPYEELIDSVYKELVSRGLRTVSLGQIETVLAGRVGTDLVVLEDPNASRYSDPRRWWLSEKNDSLTRDSPRPLRRIHGFLRRQKADEPEYDPPPASTGH